MATSPAESTTSAIERSFLLLQLVAAAAEPLGVRELGRRSGFPRSTVSRLAAQLVAHAGGGEPGGARGGEGRQRAALAARIVSTKLLDTFIEHSYLTQLWNIVWKLSLKQYLGIM